MAPKNFSKISENIDLTPAIERGEKRKDFYSQQGKQQKDQKLIRFYEKNHSVLFKDKSIGKQPEHDTTLENNNTLKPKMGG